MKKSVRNLVVLATVLVCVGCDQITKEIAKEHLVGVGTLSFLADTFRLLYAENTGAFLGLGARMPEPVRFWIFTVGVAVVLAVIAVHTLRRDETDRWQLAAIVLIVAGGVGNLVDRILRDGVVIDFMNVGIGGLRTGVFNVADMCITSGVLMLLFMELVRGKHKAAEQANPAASTDAASSEAT